jgi:hypothetical protein
MAKKSGRFKDSPFVRVLKETSQNSDLRQRLIRKVERFYESKVVTFFTSFADQDAQILDDDAEMLESLLSSEGNDTKRLILILNSPGGQALAAERIVNVCKAYSDQFQVIVPHMAKSAATMICFGADAIRMSPTAELGPVDPQVPFWPGGNQELKPRWISAQEYVRSYDELMESATSGKAKRIEPYLQQLAMYDARYIEQLRSAQMLAEDISIRLLNGSMMKGLSAADVRKKIEVFLAQTATRSHGRMINGNEAKKCGLNVEPISLGSQEWHVIWELYVRSDWAVTHRCRKIMETSEAATVL